MFSNLSAVGKLSGDLVRQLGKIVAQFHHHAASDNYINSFGAVATIKAAFEENYQESRKCKYIAVVQTLEQLEFTRNHTSSFFLFRKQTYFPARIKVRCKIRSLSFKAICY
ncbi:MAG: hypothetical protein AAF298_17245 [Cyanobacteria bacterium P01_A01_bin.40]